MEEVTPDVDQSVEELAKIKADELASLKNVLDKIWIKKQRDRDDPETNLLKDKGDFQSSKSEIKFLEQSRSKSK